MYRTDLVRDGVSNHLRPNRLFRCRSKKTSKLCVAGICEGNPPVTGGLASQRATNAEKVSIWWRHHGVRNNQWNWCRNLCHLNRWFGKHIWWYLSGIFDVDWILMLMGILNIYGILIISFFVVIFRIQSDSRGKSRVWKCGLAMLNLQIHEECVGSCMSDHQISSYPSHAQISIINFSGYVWFSSTIQNQIWSTS